MSDEATRPAPAAGSRYASGLTGEGGTGLLTDRYELTMLRAAIESGAAERRTVFEVFARALPAGRRYGVVAGTGRLLDALERFLFSPGEIDYLRSAGVIDEPTARYLATYRFGGTIWGYGEGDCYFPGSPVLVVEGTFAEAVVLETLALSIFNHDCAVASAASRMVSAASKRPVIEMGSRRTHEIAAVAAARAAYIAGFSATSNLRAGREYGVPTTGTSAHAFTLVHDDERQAFWNQVEALGPQTTLLVDTYDVPEAVRAAVELAGPALGAVRIDSGDVAEVARSVRAQLDSLGAGTTRIVATGDLDEHSIARLASAPVDSYGVGTALVTGSGAPTAALVYKLVARSAGPEEELAPVSKRSEGKSTKGGRKWPTRVLGQTGIATAELVRTSQDDYDEPGGPDGKADLGSGTRPARYPDGDQPGRPLLRHLVRDGEIIGAEPLEAARERHRRAMSELPPDALRLDPGGPVIPTVFELTASQHEFSSR